VEYFVLEIELLFKYIVFLKSNIIMMCKYLYCILEYLILF